MKMETLPCLALLFVVSMSAAHAYEYELVSKTLHGTGSGNSLDPQISGNGNYVVFSSDSVGLIENDNNGVEDVFLYDLRSTTVSRISVSADLEEANGASSSPYITSNELYVVFESLANNIHVVGDDNNSRDIFLKSLTSGSVLHASLGPIGIVGTGPTSLPSVSENGKYTAFSSRKSDLMFWRTLPRWYDQAFWYDSDSSLRLLSYDADGEPGRGFIEKIQISGDGNYVAFDYRSSNVDSAGSPGGGTYSWHIYLYDANSNIRTLISRDEFGNTLDGVLESPTISQDGRYVAFSVATLLRQDGSRSQATPGLYLYDRLTQIAQRIDFADRSIDMPYISPNGRYITYYTTYNTRPSADRVPQFSVVLLDMVTQRKYQTGPVAIYELVNYDNQSGYRFPRGLKVSVDTDGRNLAFTSNLNGLVVADQNDKMDVYIHKVPRTELGLKIEAVQDQQIGEFSESDHSTWLEYTIEVSGNFLSAPLKNELKLALSKPSHIVLVKDDEEICQSFYSYDQYSCSIEKSMASTQSFVATLYLYPDIADVDEFVVSAEISHDALEDDLQDNTDTHSSIVTQLKVSSVVSGDGANDASVAVADDANLPQDGGSGGLAIYTLAVILFLRSKRRWTSSLTARDLSGYGRHLGSKQSSQRLQ